MNLLQETIEVLADNGKVSLDVLWCGSKDLWFDWDAFARVADKTNYDNGYGGQEISDDLVIVGDGWWLERGEYDGSEWWEFKSRPTKPEKQVEPQFLKRNDTFGAYGWSSLAECKGIDNKSK